MKCWSKTTFYSLDALHFAQNTPQKSSAGTYVELKIFEIHPETAA